MQFSLELNENSKTSYQYKKSIPFHFVCVLFNEWMEDPSWLNTFNKPKLTFLSFI